MHGPPPTIPGLLADGGLAGDFRHEVAELLQRKHTGFPGAQPVSFERAHLQTLCQEDYFLCEKTDGIRCLLYCTVGDDQEEIHYLIDRKNNYYYQDPFHLPHQADPTLMKFHKETLLDGELVTDRYKDGTEVKRFLIFDCIILDGELLSKKPFDKRIGRVQAYVIKPLNQYLRNNPEAKKSRPYEMVLKDMDKPYALDEMFSKKLPNLPHGNDGLVFTCKNGPYQFGTDDQILKWKPANENSVDFKLQLGAFPMWDPGDGAGPVEDYDAVPELNLCIHHSNGDYRKFADLFVTDDEWEAMKGMNQQLDGRIIECYVADSGHWRFKKEPDGTPRFRDDKNDANHVSVMRKVIKSIEDGVTEQDLREHSLMIREGWKKRHPEET
ncbi:mRNA capping enzyme, alpha subunit [Microthyrium microscopicum]|uniref:mRNA-capping enzyme subunit alpha n=1 Tax=Microthyrium microscopicum TaxID=703497 RepID=A0A6A6UT83_9PEZI|nr:mRNA capping enzyme, alpha subunit [Microthyrium microscopicum]